MRFRAIIQARLSSSRLPRKVLEKIGSQTILEHIAARLATLEGAGVETSFALAENEPPELADFLGNRGFSYSTGAAYDVLKRYVDASADLSDHDFVIRLTGDNPFPDKDQLARLVHYARSHSLDYGYTADLPLGMGAELIRVNALRSVWLRTEPGNAGAESVIKPHHREHVTVFIRENPHLYEIHPLRLDETLSEEAAKDRVHGIRLTIDEAADLDVCRRVYLHFERLSNPLFGAVEVIQLAKNSPEMFAGNAAIVQKSALSVDERAMNTARRPE
ncbi:MAG: cytidylyltransferase domain-containing protein [Spirochaetota bacterium]